MECNHRTNAKAVSRAYYGTDNSIIIFLDDVNCTGEESHIAQCTKIGDWGLHNCDHREDAGVNCTFGKYPKQHGLFYKANMRNVITVLNSHKQICQRHLDIHHFSSVCGMCLFRCNNYSRFCVGGRFLHPRDLQNGPGDRQLLRHPPVQRQHPYRHRLRPPDAHCVLLRRRITLDQEHGLRWK